MEERDMTPKEVLLCYLGALMFAGPVVVGLHTYSNWTCKSQQTMFVWQPRTDCPVKGYDWFN